MSRAGSNPAPAEKTCLYDGSSPQNVARAATASSFKVDIVADRVTSRPSTVRFRRVPSGGVKNAFTSLAAGGQQRLADLPSRDRQRRVAGDRGRRQLDAMHVVKRKAPGLTKAEPKARKVGTVPEDELAPLLVRARRDRYPFDWLVVARLCRTHHDHARKIALLEEYLCGPRVNGRSWMQLEEWLFKLRAMLSA